MRSSAQSPNTSQSNTDSRAYRHGRLSHGAVSTRRGSRHLRTIPRCTNFLHSPVRPNSARATSSPKSDHCVGRARRSLDPAQRSLFKPRMIIAIDGPAASGKGTLGKRMAAHFGLHHLDTGLLYRAVAKALVDADDLMIIAIDGPAASGKGTLGKRLASHFGLHHLDTGLLYRAVAKALVDADDH